MFANFIIGLREGLEIALIISIITATIVKIGDKRHVKDIWIGASIAAALCIALGAVLHLTALELSERGQEIFAGIASLVAVGFVTSMIFWMRKASRTMSSELKAKTQDAAVVGALALATTAFFSVAREGLELVLFIFPTMQREGAATASGAIIGVAVASALGYGLYRRSIKLNLSRFFTVTGVMLIVVAAGILAYGIHELQEAHVLPGGDSLVYNFEEQMPSDSWWGAIIRGTFNILPKSSYLELGVYLAYLIPLGWLFLRPVRTDKAVAA